MAQGGYQGRYNQIVSNIDGQIAAYLNGDEIKNILTPGEFSEWTLDLKQGQVVVAEARSDAFDPAIEIADSTGKVLGSNDDRYPGDQRPLLFWRCTKDGSYSLRVRCFLNKAGGEFFVRYNLYDTVDLDAGQFAERSWDKPTNFLLRIPMKAGEIKQIFREQPDGGFTLPDWTVAISPLGLPDINLTSPLDQVIVNSVMASVDGDYYVFAQYHDRDKRKIRIGLREVVPAKMADDKGFFSGNSTAGVPGLWEVSVKKGQFLRVGAPNLSLNARLVLMEKPDISKDSLAKPDTNPFFPANQAKDGPGQPLRTYPARARDPREVVVYANRDATLWVGTNGAGDKGKAYAVSGRPAAQDYPADNILKGKLRIGDTAYWWFDAKIGDVMSLHTSAPDFAEHAVTYDPDMTAIWESTSDPDQDALQWNLTSVKPGRYLVAVSSLGDGGGGDYGISRKVFPAKEFGVGSAASEEMRAGGTVQVWRFKATPKEPLLIHWKSSSWPYEIAVHDDKGRNIDLHMTQVDDGNRYGIVKVNEPTSVLLVITPRGDAKYSIELSNLPKG